MPLARFALYESGVEIYIASTADDGDDWQATLVHIARESRARSSSRRVTSSARRRIRTTSRSRDLLDGDDLLGRGGSAILGPDGGYLAGPLYGEEGVLYADLEADRLYEERQRFDPAGHYNRPGTSALRAQDVARRRNTRASPTRRVRPSASKRSSRSCAGRRELPSRSRNRPSVIEPAASHSATSSSRALAYAARPIAEPSPTITARPRASRTPASAALDLHRLVTRELQGALELDRLALVDDRDGAGLVELRAAPLEPEQRDDRLCPRRRTAARCRDRSGRSPRSAGEARRGGLRATRARRPSRRPARATRSRSRAPRARARAPARARARSHRPLRRPRAARRRRGAGERGRARRRLRRSCRRAARSDRRGRRRRALRVGAARASRRRARPAPRSATCRGAR